MAFGLFRTCVGIRKIDARLGVGRENEGALLLEM
jgi:hypothetical protein